MLSPLEKPLVIQDLRLRQAGYTDAERPEELGKDDLMILCKFIFQTPVLPVMDPVSQQSLVIDKRLILRTRRTSTTRSSLSISAAVTFRPSPSSYTSTPTISSSSTSRGIP
jgi:adenylate cyclase